MSKRSLALLVEDLWESIEKIERYTEGMTQDSFQSIFKKHSLPIGQLNICSLNSNSHKKGYEKQASYPLLLVPRDKVGTG